VLSVLLEERHQEVDGQLSVEGDVAGGQEEVSDGEGHAEHHLLDEGVVLVLIQGGRELSNQDPIYEGSA
jgi:hypothetical protein